MWLKEHLQVTTMTMRTSVRRSPPMAAATMIRRGRPSANEWSANVSIFEEEREQVPIGLRLTVVEARPRALVTVQVYSPNCWSVREVTSRLLLTIGPCWVSSTE